VILLTLEMLHITMLIRLLILEMEQQLILKTTLLVNIFLTITTEMELLTLELIQMEPPLLLSGRLSLKHIMSVTKYV